MHRAATRTKVVSSFARAAAAALLAVLGVAGASTASHAADDVSWAVRTASNSFGAERTSYTYTLDPGGTVDDALVVVNHGTEALDLQVYAADGFTTSSGQFDVLKKDDESTSVGAWVAAQSGSVTVQPGVTVEVPFTLAVPEHATPGDYAGAIVTSLVRPDETQQVNVDQRLGIRINLHVGGEVAPAMTVDDARVHYSGGLNPFAAGDATITYTIHNTGNVILSARQEASAAGPFGWLAAGAGDVAAAPELLPGESWDVTVPVHGVWPLFRVAASATVTPLFTDASGSTTALAAIAASASGWAVPWTALVVLLLVVVAVVWAVLRRRRVRVRRKAREDERVQQAVEQALREREATGDTVADTVADADATERATSAGRPA